MSEDTITTADADRAELEQLRAERDRLLADKEAPAEPEVAEVNITPTSQRGPLAVNYAGERYLLPGRVPADFLRALDSVQRPKGMAGVQKTEYQESVSIATIASFLNQVVPDDFRAILDMEDVPQVYAAWEKHTGLGKASSSGS